MDALKVIQFSSHKIFLVFNHYNKAGSRLDLAHRLQFASLCSTPILFIMSFPVSQLHFALLSIPRGS
jgi:hypothetical protein